MRFTLVILCCSLVIGCAEAQQFQPSDALHAFEVHSLVLRSDNMRFIVYRPKGKAANGTPTYEEIVVRDSRREDVLVAAQRLREGRLVPRYRSIVLHSPIAEFYVGDDPVLRLHTLGDRLVCITKDASVVLLFGEKEVRELRDLFDRFKKANQSPEPTPTAGASAAEQPLVPAAVVAHL